MKTRSGAFSLLKELVVVLRGALTEHVGALIPGVQFSLGVRLHAFLSLILHLG